jgi:uncharacterized protein YdeI (YjbR/CyaY-like superfamily)
MSGAATTIPADLQSALNAYKTNYAAYKVTGNAAYKTAYENALRTVNAGIGSVSAAVGVNDTFIQGFINSYTTTNQDISVLQAKSKAIQAEGPALQDTLIKTQQLNGQIVNAADETSLYVKAGIVVGLLVIAGIIGAL